MIVYGISRINTEHGIFRVSGWWCHRSCSINDFNITVLEMMNTDGWSELDLSSEHVRKLIDKIKHQLLEHLVSTNKL